MISLFNIMPLKNIIQHSYEEISHTTDKKLEYEKILLEFLSLAAPTKAPLCIHLGGIPGAGKTTFYNSRSWPNHVLFQCDSIMEKLSDYQTTLRSQGSKEAFKRFELIARIIAYELLDRAINNKLNIVLDHSGLFEEHVIFLKNIKKKYNYRTEMHFIICNLTNAIYRVEKRQQNIGRYVPKSIVIDRFKKVRKLLPLYRKTVDHFTLWTNNVELGFIPDTTT